jgi:hypothetical protein
MGARLTSAGSGPESESLSVEGRGVPVCAEAVLLVMTAKRLITARAEATVFRNDTRELRGESQDAVSEIVQYGPRELVTGLALQIGRAMKRASKWR